MSLFTDLQVNGAFGIDFNDDSLTNEGFVFACEQLHKQGTVGFLPTVITNSIAVMCSRIERIVQFTKSSDVTRRIIKGIHVEGPFISGESGFVGTHPRQHVMQAHIEYAKQLMDAGNGMVRLWTLAPEQDPDGAITEMLSRQGVRVFAGHTNASRDQLMASIDRGLCGFTHLGNGCPHMMDRHDNIIQRVLSLRHQLYITLIADGVHLPEWLLDSFVESIGPDRTIIISDAMSAAGMPPGEYFIGGQPIQVDTDRRTSHRDHGYLAGSASTLFDMYLKMMGRSVHKLELLERIFNSNAASLLGIPA